MQTTSFETPIAFIVFKRPDTTSRVFDAISRVRPAKLLLIADGPRNNQPDEADACRQVRSIISRVDWPCEVLTNFSATNLGCCERVVSGLNWVFSLVDDAIILEDDCLPDPSFFPFCREMLNLYRENTSVSMVSGYTALSKYLTTKYSYFASRWTHIWGWATWRRAWARYDRKLESWPEVKESGILHEVFATQSGANFWIQIFDKMHSGNGPDTWDYQWFYANLVHNSISIVPRVNLIENIGFTPDATHTANSEGVPSQNTYRLDFPLAHPPSLVPLRSMDILDQKIWNWHTPNIPQRTLNKLMHMWQRKPR